MLCLRVFFVVFDHTLLFVVVSDHTLLCFVVFNHTLLRAHVVIEDIL